MQIVTELIPRPTKLRALDDSMESAGFSLGEKNLIKIVMLKKIN